MSDLARHIRDIPDFPKPGHPLQGHHAAVRRPRGFPGDHRPVGGGLSRPRRYRAGHRVAWLHRRRRRGVRSRHGAARWCASPASCPSQTYSAHYELEYGKDTLEDPSRRDRRGHRVLLVDDLLATGGTASAAARADQRDAAGPSPVSRSSWSWPFSAGASALATTRCARSSDTTPSARIHGSTRPPRRAPGGADRPWPSAPCSASPRRWAVGGPTAWRC
jgi:adenine phosphoribosyltransferase